MVRLFQYFIVQMLMLNLESSRFIKVNKTQLPFHHGEVWPIPKLEIKQDNFYALSKTFFFQLDSKDARSELLQNVTKRFLDQFENLKNFTIKNPITRWHLNYGGEIRVIKIVIDMCCERLPHSKMVEDYSMMISSDILIHTLSIWGVIRALDTLFQLCYITKEGLLILRENMIQDAPRYSHRGLLLDTESFYLPVDSIMKMLDGMAMQKMNVLHWRIVGDTSFPYESNVFPELSEKGAFHWTQVYDETSIQRIIEYATIRGIRVIPEINLPGHIWSIHKSHPEILTRCFADGPPTGPLNPTEERTFEIIELLLREVQERFPDTHIHLGGDEVDEYCWASNPDIRRFVIEHNIVLNLHIYFLKRLLDDGVFKFGKTIVVAQDVLNHDMVEYIIPKNALYQAYSEDLYKKMIGNNYHEVILSWQWDLASVNNITLYYMYAVAQDFLPLLSIRNFVVGGEAFLNTNSYTDPVDVFDSVWPRACIAADVLWRGLDEDHDFKNPKIMEDITKRVKEQMYRLFLMGLPLTHDKYYPDLEENYKFHEYSDDE